MKSVKWWALVAAIGPLMVMPALAAGCSGEGEHEPSEGPLRQARAQWAATRATDYTYTLRVGCF